MKSHVNHLFIAMIFLALFSAELNAEEIKLKVVNGAGPQPRSLILIPIEVYQTQSSLEIEFFSNVGEAIITISDTMNQQQALLTFDTAFIPFIQISFEDWESGDYIITILYLNLEFKGCFNVSYNE